MRIFKWGINNPVTVNLVMIIILFMGFSSAFDMKRAMFPEFTIDLVQITVIMEDGSTPDQIDKNIVQLIIPRIQNVDGVKEIRSTATDQSANIHVEVDTGYNPNLVKQDIKDEIDRIRHFPKKALDPQIIVVDMRHRAIQLAIYGKGTSDLDLRKAAESVKRDLQNKGIASKVEMFAPRPFEITVSLPTTILQAKGLSINSVSQQISQNSLEGIAGEIHTGLQNIVLKGEGRKTQVDNLGKIPIKFANGEFILLKDLAGPGGIRDNFSEDYILQEFNGNRAILININKTLNDDIIELCDRVREYSQTVTLPEGVHIHALHDMSVFVKDRLTLIVKNGLIGLVLIVIVLALFLEWQTAFWTSMGIGFSLIGALGFLYLGGESINMISLFAFLMTMGVIVDDAIVIGEGYFRKRQEGASAKDAALKVLNEVAKPVTAMMLTTIVAFIPLLFITGMMGKFIHVMPIVVITALVLSLFEALFILPVHLAHHCSSKPTPFMKVISYILRPIIYLSERFQPKIENYLTQFSDDYLNKAILLSVRNRYTTSVIFLAILIFLFGLIPAGIVKTSVFPQVDSDFHKVELEFDRGTSIKTTEIGIRSIEDSMLETGKYFERETGINPVQEYFTEIGAQGSHRGSLVVELKSIDLGRKTSGQAFLDKWRNSVPRIPNVASLEFGATSGGPRGKAIEILLSSDDSQALQKAEKATLSYLATIPNVVDINTSNLPGAQTVEVKLKSEFNNLPISEADLISVLTRTYQGVKVDTFYRNENEVNIYVRAKADERSNLLQMKNLYLDSGMTVEQVAIPMMKRDPGQIKRVNSSRTTMVFANVDLSSNANVAEIREQTEEEFLSTFAREHPQVTWSYSGEAKAGTETFNSMVKSYIPALLTIYLILATVFRSYLQPMIIMAAIPFSFVGAVLGHLIMGIPINLLSVFGIVGLTGIAVNDSLVLIDCINTHIQEGQSLEDALVKGTGRRLRPILLTSLTTIASMSPILLETSFQAQFLIPMVTSIVFGLISTTGLILILVPVGFAISNDLLIFSSKMRSKLLLE
ncbi:MAG: HAE1 family hydrophobic/amphiphilic exporter-1 [Chlamydiales bacterium]|jgi:HAE1 family hydrophobic/amphiphilic exporter-1